MRLGKQTTLRRPAALVGAGVHSNAPVNLVLHPAPADTGIVFIRTGLPDGRERRVAARWSEVSTTELCTVIGDQSRGSVSTIEHLLAALAGLGVDNVEVEIDGPEVPIMDGSAAAFVAAIDRVGVKTLPASRRYIKVLKPVRVEQGRGFSELLPAAEGFHLDVEIDYALGVIGRQRKTMTLTASSFRSEIARARTFGSIGDVERLWALGFALGSTLENSIAVDGDRILNPEGLRSATEFVEHKTLDAIGDLALAGAPIIGTYRAFCPGHRMNALALNALFADRSAYAMVEEPARPKAAYKDYALSARPVFAEVN